MMEARAGEFAALCSGAEEVERAIDRWVWYAGFADKLSQVLGGTNPVAGPYFNFTIPEPTGVVAVVAPDEPALAGLVSRIAPALVGGNAVVAVASETHPLAAVELAEAIATSDVPGGVVNILTGHRAELAPWLASHMDVNAIDLTGADGLGPELERAAADNVKRVVRGGADSQSLYEISAFLELKTVWHPIGVYESRAVSAFDDVREIVPQQIWSGVVGRSVHGAEATLSVLTLEPDVNVPEHSHANEQMGVLVHGSVTFRSVTSGSSSAPVRPG